MLPALDFATQAKYHMFSSGQRARFHDFTCGVSRSLKADVLFDCVCLGQRRKLSITP